MMIGTAGSASHIGDLVAFLARLAIVRVQTESPPHRSAAMKTWKLIPSHPMRKKWHFSSQSLFLNQTLDGSVSRKVFGTGQRPSPQDSDQLVIAG